MKVLNPGEKLLFVIHDHTVQGRTRLQKYGFLLSELYKTELKEIQAQYSNFEFYDDWRAHHYGPYSQKLQDDLELCLKNNLIIKRENMGDQYCLTLKGRVKWRKLYTNSENEMSKLSKKISNMQKTSLYSLLKSIYKAYPEQAVNSKIKDYLK